MKNSVNKETGLVEEGKLNEVVTLITKRPDGTLRIQQDFQYCPTMTEQHSANETDINYLIKRFKPDELSAYIAARAFNKREILGHDFSVEPTIQDARNTIYQLRKQFDELAPEIKNNFKNHVEYLKFIDNPLNQEKMIKLGLMTPREIKKTTQLLDNEPNDDQKTIKTKTSPSSESK